MVVRLQHDVFCDRCDARFSAFVSTEPDKAAARSFAEDAGWKHEKHGNHYIDLCPDCQKEAKGEG